MTEERWQEILGQVKDNFPVEQSETVHSDDEGGRDVEFVIFKGPLGRMKLEYESKAVILDKKTNYSNRIGSHTQVEYVYSDLEKSHKLHVYKWDDDSQFWVEIEAKNFE